MTKKAKLIVAVLGLVLGIVLSAMARVTSGPSYQVEPPDCIVPRVRAPASLAGAPTEGLLAPGAFGTALDEVITKAKSEGTDTTQLSSASMYSSDYLFVSFVTTTQTIRYTWYRSKVDEGTPNDRSEYEVAFPTDTFRDVNVGVLYAHATQLCGIKNPSFNVVMGAHSLAPIVEIQGKADDTYVTVSYDETYSTIPTWWLPTSDLQAELRPMLAELRSVTDVSVDDSSISVTGLRPDGTSARVTRWRDDALTIDPDTTSGSGRDEGLAPSKIDGDIIAWAIQRAAIEVGENPRRTSVDLDLDLEGKDTPGYGISIGGRQGYHHCFVGLDGSDFRCRI